MNLKSQKLIKTSHTVSKNKIIKAVGGFQDFDYLSSFISIKKREEIRQ